LTGDRLKAEGRCGEREKTFRKIPSWEGQGVGLFKTKDISK
jgi:hypothetical protein